MREASLASCRRGRGGRASGPAAVDGRERRTPRCRRGSGPQHGSRSQAGGPSQRQRRSARAVGGPREIGGQRQPKGGSAGQFARCCSWRREVLLLTGGRESPRAGFSGRTGAGGGNLAGGRSKRRSILATVPAAPTLPACPPHRCPVQRTHSAFGRNLPCTTLSLPSYHPDAPTPTPPSVRLPRTMPCYGTSRVRVLECPPLGRPSLIKLVLVKTSLPLLCSPFPPRAPTSTSPASDCTAPCRVMVHSEYAYSSALLWADLP